jgi:hypothetical protein
MIFLRHYGDSDEERVKELHKMQGLAYELPSLKAPSMLVRSVVEENGIITHAAFLRKTAEAYWIFDPSQSRRQRLGRMLALTREMTILAKQAGFEDVQAWLPPELASDKKLDLTMLNQGWKKPLWTCYAKELK